MDTFASFQTRVLEIDYGKAYLHVGNSAIEFIDGVINFLDQPVLLLSFSCRIKVL